LPLDFMSKAGIGSRGRKHAPGPALISERK
jgi:hypothetical protein